MGKTDAPTNGGENPTRAAAVGVGDENRRNERFRSLIRTGVMTIIGRLWRAGDTINKRTTVKKPPVMINTICRIRYDAVDLRALRSARHRNKK